VIERRYERVPFLCEVVIAPQPKGAPVPAHSLDISLVGAGLTTTAGFAVGLEIAIDWLLRDPSHRETKERTVGRVVYFNADTDANRIGVEFLEPISELKTPELFRRLVKR
jgi:c-di-GMP-binding flagellar brake protein YcgR